MASASRPIQGLMRVSAGFWAANLALHWQIIHAAARCKSTFDNAGIAAAVVERRARGWRGARRAKSAEAEARGFFFFRRPAAARRRCWRKAYAIIVMSAWR